MSANKKSKYMTPFIIGASDLAFILLFFFIMIGSGVQTIDKIEMPFKTSNNNSEVQQAPFRIEIYAEQENIDSCYLAVIHNADLPDTLYMVLEKNALADVTAFAILRDNLQKFIETKKVEIDSMSVDVYSSAYSYYGLIAITLAACNQLEYPCNLVYRTEEA